MEDDDLIRADLNDSSIDFNYFVEFDSDIYYHNDPQLLKMAAQHQCVLHQCSS